ncbi:hypothetical protein [Rhodopseudomonas sp. B29]|uniref:hypothetical protein n=1 Tax=Rhodopseudomonas sp. B29 TaxID=95607 RepID=UPI000344AE1A|nr:hypothetical protein [Rhodopseudomonas sp. B29]
MAHYVVRFLKDILGDNGRHAEICQSLLDIEADDSASAIEIAKQRFCEIERVDHWSLHADRIHAAEGEFPS